MEHIDKIEFKKADSDDIPLISKMIQKLYLHENTIFIEADVQNALEELIKNESFGATWLIYYDKSVSGYIIIASAFSIEFKGETAFIDELYIDDNYRSKGIGRTAIKFAKEYALKRDYKALRLEVEYLNTKAQMLYRKMGFKEHERKIMTKWIYK